ncbi:phosphoribosylpyrophosphate synthetase [Taibaiella sp. KBW10]|uniref:ribose-phosphate diphosphokinase n=1 Tax=Taibaiella sp. KBW10 TaxID=2153357 RepID=UPI000F596111|nr:ribose-phosphate diphosphokinase [Taibaiella sp. KBW10]RQO32277.1 phosphoribosylpyrophosphate synthetase [Taibaiella sp. KBW10]
MILNLDRNFSPVAGTPIAFESFIFSGGEPHIRIQADFDISEPVIITHRFNTFQDIGLLCLAVDALRRLGVAQISLFIPYFPAARQDRVMVPGEPLSVKVNADIINSLGLHQVWVYDPHSEVTPALLNRVTVMTNHKFIRNVAAAIGGDLVLISPDGGALKKIYKVAEALGGVPVIECSKVRDVATGKLKSFSVYADDLAGKTCLLVDDICDGGGTFIGLAEALKQKNAGSLYVAVSHGIFSKGFDGLNQWFERIYTTNSIRDWEEQEVMVEKITLD